MVKLRKNRYIIFEIICKETFMFRDVLNAILNSMLSLYGEFGLSRINFSLLRYYSDKHFGIFRCDHLSVGKVIASITLIKSINNVEVIFNILKITGTLKKAERILNKFIQK